MKSHNFSLDGNQLKLIAVFFMIFDHIYTYTLIDVLPQWCSLIARFVAPLFVYFLVEGFFHTSNWKRYLFRILGATALPGLVKLLLTSSSITQAISPIR